MNKHTPSPWTMSGPMGTDHLHGREPWFWVSAERTLHIRVAACSDGFVRGENEANARLLTAAPDLLTVLQAAVGGVGLLARQAGVNVELWEAWERDARATIAKATGSAS